MIDAQPTAAPDARVLNAVYDAVEMTVFRDVCTVNDDGTITGSYETAEGTVAVTITITTAA